MQSQVHARPAHLLSKSPLAAHTKALEPNHLREASNDAHSRVLFTTFAIPERSRGVDARLEHGPLRRDAPVRGLEAQPLLHARRANALGGWAGTERRRGGAREAAPLQPTPQARSRVRIQEPG
jgi:hypothetical protein